PAAGQGRTVEPAARPRQFVNPVPARLLVITDRHQAGKPLAETVADCLAGGARWILFRDKDLPPADRRELARRVAAAVRSVPGARLSVSGDPALAEEVEADGVHVQSLTAIAEARKRLRPRCVIGFSAHRPEEVRAAGEAGADYVTLSPVFVTASKPGYGPALGTAAIAEASRSDVQVLALGGVTPATAGSCFTAGAAGVAVMGEAMRAADPVIAIRALLASFGREGGDAGAAARAEGGARA
ncbi:MAG: thiamine phosphate synthase, partial [Alphaproteobacteria bacterium]